MPRARRRKLAPGIWQDVYGISVVFSSRVTGYQEVRYPLGTPLADLKLERDELRSAMKRLARDQAPTPPRPQKRHTTTLAEDAAAYLRAVRALTTYHQRAQQIAVWLTVRGADGVPFGERRRSSIQPHEIQAQRDAWRTLPDPATQKVKSAGTVNKYLRALSNLYRVLDPKGESPVRAVRECDEPGALPRAIAPELVSRILSAMPPSKTRARLMVLATTGIEQATFARLAPEDVDLEAQTVRLPRRRKGRAGAFARLLPLSASGVAAFREVIAFQAWGPFSHTSAYKSFKAACRKVQRAHNRKAKKGQRINLKTLRVKDLRHTFGTAISLATGGNTATIQMFLGHATPDMADRYRQAAIPIHLREAATALRVKRLEVPLGSRKLGRK